MQVREKNVLIHQTGPLKGIVSRYAASLLLNELKNSAKEV